MYLFLQKSACMMRLSIVFSLFGGFIEFADLSKFCHREELQLEVFLFKCKYIEKIIIILKKPNQCFSFRTNSVLQKDWSHFLHFLQWTIDWGIVPIDIFHFFFFLPLGTIISSKKEELIGILDHFNIQVVCCSV